jgi:hypothetical protein
VIRSKLLIFTYLEKLLSGGFFFCSFFFAFSACLAF